MSAAIERLKNQIPLKLIILDEGTERENLTHIISEKSQSEKLDLHEFEDNPFTYYGSCLSFCFSSALEGLSMVLFEALASDCEAISTDSQYWQSEVLLQGEHGIISL